MTPCMRRFPAGAPAGSWRFWAAGLAVIAALLVAAGSATARRPSPEDERFWTADSLLTTRVDSLGALPVRAEVRAVLREAMAINRDASVVVGHDVEGWIRVLRWAAILGDEKTLPMIDAIAEIPRHRNNAVAHFRLTYYARWAGYRIRSAGLPDAARGELLCEWARSENPWQRVFAEDRLANSGPSGVRALRDCVARELLPEPETMDAEPFSEMELAPLRRYLRFVGLLVEAIETEEERVLIEEWRDDPDARKRRLAEDVLAMLPR